MSYVYAASEATCAAWGFLNIIYQAVFWPLIVLLTAAALLVFLYGGFKFVLNADNPTERDTGRRHMIYGVIGLLVMVSALAILTIAAATFNIGLPNTNECRSTNPDESGSIPGEANASIPA